jgi:hypothetical protein
MNTYKFLIWDWMDSLGLGWTTVDQDKGFEIFRRHTGECVTLTALAPTIRFEVDRQLRETPGYVGAFALDAGNPLHREAFSDGLIHAASITHGAVVQELSFEGDADWPTRGAESFKPGGLVWKPYGWSIDHGPPDLARLPLSERGRRFQDAFTQKHAGQVQHRVLEAILCERDLSTRDRSFSFNVVGRADDVLQAVMPEGKFTKYLFDPDHKDGASKGAFFTGVLGIQPDDWRFLAAQFYDGLLLSKLEDMEFRDWDDGYGIRFNTYIRIQGRAGATAVVKAGWMMRPGFLPSLSSAMPARRDRNAVQPPLPPILPPGERTDVDWKTLWAWAAVAGTRALREAVPTPMFLEGFPPLAEGEVGFGAVRVPDARRGFARWLILSGHAERHFRSGAVVCSPPETASFERGMAWAKAFAKVLMMNGLTAEIEEHLT